MHLAGNPMISVTTNHNAITGQISINEAMVELAPITSEFNYVGAMWTNHTVPDILRYMKKMTIFTTELCALRTIPEFFTAMPNLVEWHSVFEIGLLSDAGLLPTIFARLPHLEKLQLRRCML